MPTLDKALQLIITTVEGTSSRTLLSDSLTFHPSYQVGDVIHLLHQPDQVRTLADDHQYVIRHIKHVILKGENDGDSSTYVLLVEVVKLTNFEQE